VHDIPAFLRHLLERVDWTRDLHFQTQTTIDTLDYSGGALNSGSKVVIAACGPKRRELGTDVPPGFSLPDVFRKPRLCLPGILAIETTTNGSQLSTLNSQLSTLFPLIVLVDDSDFTAATLNNFLWV